MVYTKCINSALPTLPPRTSLYVLEFLPPPPCSRAFSGCKVANLENPLDEAVAAAGPQPWAPEGPAAAARSAPEHQAPLMPPPLPALEQALRHILGNPHNYDGFAEERETNWGGSAEAAEGAADSPGAKGVMASAAATLGDQAQPQQVRCRWHERPGWQLLWPHQGWYLLAHTCCFYLKPCSLNVFHRAACVECLRICLTPMVQAAGQGSAALDQWKQSWACAAAAAPLRHYLLDSVVPVITAGLAECVVTQPKDPIQVNTCVVLLYCSLYCHLQHDTCASGHTIGVDCTCIMLALAFRCAGCDTGRFIQACFYFTAYLLSGWPWPYTVS